MEKPAWQMLLKELGIVPIETNDHELYASFLDSRPGWYANTWTYMVQAANGYGLDLPPLGFKLLSEGHLFTLAVFLRPTDGKACIQVINPLGKASYKKIGDLVKQLGAHFTIPIYLKKVDNVLFKNLLRLRGFYPAREYPWHPGAALEDDTYPEVTLRIESALKLLQRTEKNEVRDKYQRFLRRNLNKNIEWRVLDNSTKDAALFVIRRFFTYKRDMHVSISTVDDYRNMLEFPPAPRTMKSYLSEILFINDEPVALLVMERIGSSRYLGMYANLSLYQEHRYLSEYVLIKALEKARAASATFVNLGGSESKGLHDFKLKFRPSVPVQQANWVVYLKV